MEKYPIATISALLGCPTSELIAVLKKRKLLNELADEYDLVTPIKAYVAYLKENSLDSQKAAQEKIKTESMTMELERKKGTLVAVIEVQNTIQAINDSWVSAFSFLEKSDLTRGVKAFADMWK